MKGRKVNQGVKLMMIRDYLYSHTNETHWVTANDIIRYLESKDIEVDRKTIYEDIFRLEVFYGLELERRGKKGYRIKTPHFQPYELRLMVDAVQSARFITTKEAANITNKIKDLADVYTRPTLERRSYVNERIQTMDKSVVARTDVIHEAISNDHQLSFNYTHFDPVSRKRVQLYRDEPFRVSPFALYWHGGNYYLFAYNSEVEDFRYFRIDRMENIQELKKQRDGYLEFKKMKFGGQPEAKIFDMYGHNKQSIVQLRFFNDIADQVIDAFGEKTMITVRNRRSEVSVMVEVGPTFFAWVATFGKKMKITYPPDVVNGMKKFLKNASNMYEEE